METRSYVWIYFVLSLTVTLVISAVIYFRESAIELKSFSYLLVVGYKKLDVVLIVFVKWLFLFLAGFIAAMIIFFLLNSKNNLIADIGLLLRIVCESFLLNLILLTGVAASILNFKMDNGK